MNAIHKLLDSRNVHLFNDEEIAVWSTRYFEEIYHPPPMQVNHNIGDVLPRVINQMVDDNENQNFNKNVYEEEVREVVFLWNILNPQSPNGFPPTIF